MIRLRFTSLLCALLILTCIPASSQSKKDRAEKLMRTYHDFNMFDGAVLLAENGKIIYQGAFGRANHEWNIANTVDSKFMIGSVSKPITSILMLIQVQKGLIDLDKTISDYLPEFSNANGKRITIRQLLSHSSGMPNYDVISDFFPRISRQNWTREDYVKLYMDSAVVFEPGSSYAYSSWGYFTLGYIMERVTGKSYSELMKQDIFDKIDMNSSGSYQHMQVVPKRAVGYDYSVDKYRTGDFRDQSNTMGTGDLYSTVGDLFKLHLALTNNTLLNKELSKEMFTPGIRPWRYGFGWFNQMWKYTPMDSVFVNYHLGMTEGFLSFLVRVPETNSLLVFLCNSSPTDFFGIASNLLRILHNKPVIQKRPLHKVLASSIPRRGIEGAILEFDRLKADTAHYYIEWWNMDQLGHQLYDLKRYEEARALYEKNILEFPTRDLVFVSLGQCYEALNRKEDAMAQYRKAISINAKNEEARNRLKGLENKK